MTDERPASDLDAIRHRIDSIDDAILDLLEQRAAAALEVARAKEREGRASFYDPERERRIVERLTAARPGRLPSASVRAVYREIISACLSLQKPLRIAYLGPEGTFSQMAARQLFGDAAAYWDASTIDGVFDAVVRGDTARGVVPIENSSEGSVAATVRALLHNELFIEREIVLQIAHCLLTRAPSLSAIARVYSHPQALAQCALWLHRNLPDIPTIDKASTSAAVLEALADPEGAALASRVAEDLYHLPVLCQNVQDVHDNATRFLVIGKSDANPTGNDKTTLAFSLEDSPGALRRALQSFEEEGITLTRIESHPSRERAWGYVFLCDMAGHRLDPQLGKAIDRLRAACAWVKLLGSYPRYRPA